MMLSISTVIPSFLPKKNHLLHILVVISLKHFIAEYVSNLPSTYFLSSTKKLQNKIVFKDIVNALMENYMVLQSFTKVMRNSPDNIKKETAFSLLEDLVLYIRVRTFSFVKDKVQAFKIRNSKTKSRSLRTGMKQSTSFTL